MLGLSRQAFIARTKKPTSLKPVARLKAGPVWTAFQIENYAADRSANSASARRSRRSN